LKQDERLPKNEIIKRSNDFSRIITDGERWTGKYLRIYFEKSTKRQVGFAVSKRYGNAVKRNRVKRLFREIYRKRRNRIGNYQMVMMGEKGIVRAGFSEIEKEFDRFLNEIFE
jgi:ribonuclease P protein component